MPPDRFLTTPQADASPMPIAVIGMSGQFPGASTVDALWELLIQGRDGVTEAPPDRPWFRQLLGSQPRTPGRVPSTRGGFLPSLDRFDAAFFDMSPREARRTDPQVRLLLETGYEAVQDAGFSLDRLRTARTGVFVANIGVDYWLRQVDDLDGLDIYAELGAHSRAAFSGRLAYAFDLHGPAMTIDTACSSSLTAVHLACQSLRAGECETALVGAANVILTPCTSLTFGWAGSLSPDGRCGFADASANGFVRSEAVAAVLLKPLARAVDDGDRVRAVIRGSAVGNDGFSGNGMAAPSVDGQVAVLRSAYEQAGVDTRDVAFVEAHGTGTPIGDRVELTALSQVLGPRSADQPQCLVGSAKTSVGHTEAAAGLTGLIKAVLSLEHRRVPAVPLRTGLTSSVDWQAVPLQVPAETTRLRDTGSLLAGVSSFGVSGTNAHVVLSSAPQQQKLEPPDETAGQLSILAISARTGTALRALADRYAELLQPANRRQPPLARLCRAAATRRDHFEHRLAVVSDSADDMAGALRDFQADRKRADLMESRDDCPEPPGVVFVFPGQGSQWMGMGRSLLAVNGPFQEAMDACDAVVRAHAGWSVLDTLRSQDTGWLGHTPRVQPMLWAMGVALAALWRSWGIHPDAVLGQSQGEIAAAHCAGALTLDQAGHLICLRAELVDQFAPQGAMCWVELAHTDIPELLEKLGAVAAVAVVESPTSTVLAGEVDQIERIVSGCESHGVSCQRVEVAYAAHSPQIDPLRQPLLDGLSGLQPSAATVPFWSTVTGRRLTGESLGSEYWWRNLRFPVRLDQIAANELSQRPVAFLQMSPHPVLTSALRANAAAHGLDALVLGSLQRGRPELDCLLRTVAALYTAGVDPDWARVHGGRGPAVTLPHYPWQRARHWYQASTYPWPAINSELQSTAPAPQQEATMTPVPDPLPAHPWLAEINSGPRGRLEWHGRLDRDRDRFLLGHRVSGQALMPGAGFLELAMAAALSVADGPVELRHLEFVRPLPLVEQRPWEVELRVTAEPADAQWRLGIASRDDAAADWTDHATATLISGSPADAGPPPSDPPEEIRRRCAGWQAGESFYRGLATAGNDWRGAFRGIAELWRGNSEALARLRPTDAAGFRFHPATLDTCLQAVVAVLIDEADADRRGVVLTSVDQARIHQLRPSRPLWSHARLAHSVDHQRKVDVTVLDDSATVVAEFAGIGTRRAEISSARPNPADHAVQPGLATNWRHLLRWQETPAVAPSTEVGHWLLIGGDGLDALLAQRLSAAGCAVSTAAHADRFAIAGPGRIHIAPGSDADIARALAAAEHIAPLHGVVSLQALTAGADETASARHATWMAADLCSAALSLAKATLQLKRPVPPRLFLVTRGAQAAAEQDSCPAPWQAALWGVGRVLSQEQQELSPVLIDLDEHDADNLVGADDLAAVLLAPGAENQVALRDRRRLVARLVPEPVGTPSTASGEAAVQKADEIAGFHLRPSPSKELAPGQIEVQVSHAGLSYRDVRSAAGAPRDHDGQTAAVGLECAGVVTRIGDGVATLAVGDHVLAFADSALRTHVVVDARLAVHKPERMSAANAGAIPIAYGTAYHGLIELADLRPGERVLIHSATGGVGRAAMEIARWRGATIYATAGTPDKRELLLKLGAAKVADSRTADFAEQLRDPGLGEHRGVDVVLNTLTGAAVVEANVSLLNPFGRYIDLAQDDDGMGQPSLAILGDDRSYLPVNLPRLCRNEPDRAGELLQTVTDLVDGGQLALPAPRVFATEDAAEAFSLMERASHIGKLALAFPPFEGPVPPRQPQTRAPQIRADATYLVTGGLSGVGALAARWLIDQGARHLLLTGRREVTADHASPDPRSVLLANLRSLAADVQYAAVDVADLDAMAKVVGRRERDGKPGVAGVVHSAATLDPAPALDLTVEDLDTALHAKAAGAWVLQEMFAGQPLDFFVLFSSAVSLLGNLSLGSQLAAYAAANAFVDALATRGRTIGRPTTVVNWGYWADTGLAHRLSQASGHDVRPAGMLPVRPADAPRLFAAMLAADGQLICLPADWSTYVAAYPQDGQAPLLRDLTNSHWVGAPAPRQLAADQTSRPNATPMVAAPLPTAPPAGSRVTTDNAANQLNTADWENWLAEQLGQVLGLSPDQVNRSQPTNKLGIDSLMAADLRSRLRREHNRDVTITRLLGATSLRALAAELADAGHDSHREAL